MSGTLTHYTDAFRRLHTDVNRQHWSAATGFRAPHKMLLLLVVTDLVEQGSIARNFVELSPALLDQFAGYWSAIMPTSRRGDVFKPFFHLRSDRFWHLASHQYTATAERGKTVTRWLGWWAEIDGISMVHRTKLGKYRVQPGVLESYGTVEYYYVATLKQASGDTATHPFDAEYPFPSVPPPAEPHRPLPSTWAALRSEAS